MSLVLLIPLSLVMGLAGVAAFVWAMRHNQFEDLEGAAWRVLLSETNGEQDAGARIATSGPAATGTTPADPGAPPPTP